MEQNLKAVKMVMALSQSLQSKSLFCPLGFIGPSLGTQSSLARPDVRVAFDWGKECFCRRLSHHLSAPPEIPQGGAKGEEKGQESAGGREVRRKRQG